MFVEFTTPPASPLAAEQAAIITRDQTMIGRSVSHYQILEKLGEGGMGVVYKARDTRLGRFVAIKMLSPAAVSNHERRLRFTQEAKAASALNHPNIITVYDIESDGEFIFIVMEYLDGHTLDQLIGSKGLPAGTVVEYAAQIADALTTAHAAGIVHRDLKPANIMVTGSGLIKLLDFGLAKLTDIPLDSVDGTTVTVAPRTEQGAILGTVAYMSPEQAEGRAVDGRSDIFAFGTVLYEMATGQKPFRGDSKLSVLSSILREDPRPVGEFTPGLPRDLEVIIGRCLRKDPARRIQTMSDLKVALEEIKEDTGAGRMAAGGIRPAGGGKRLLQVALGVLAVCLVAGAAWLLFGPTSTQVEPMQVLPLTSYPGSEECPSFSPDGGQVAFSWNGEGQDNYDIYVKLAGGGPPLRLTKDQRREVSPAWSPDGREIAFLREGAVFVVSALGGPERKITDTKGPFYPRVAWTPDAKWLAVQDRTTTLEPYSLFLVSVSSGTKRRITWSPPDGSGDHDPAVSPDGRSLAFVRWFSNTTSDIFVVPLKGGDARRLTADERAVVGLAWMPDSRELIFSSDRGGGRSLWRIAANPPAGAQPQPLAGAGDNAFNPVIARAGSSTRLVYQRTESDANIWRMDAAGRETHAVQLIASTRTDQSPQFSPDGGRVAFASDRSGDLQIWVCEFDGSNPVQLTSFKTAHVGTPRWSPDGSRIAFDALNEGNRDIFVIGAGGGTLLRLTSGTSSDARPSWSTDGRWVYFRSDRSGSREIWKIPADGGEAVQVTRNGGFEAFESVDGKLLFYVKTSNERGLWSIPVAGGQERLILEPVRQSYWAVAGKGIYFLDLDDATFPRSRGVIKVFHFATGETSRIAAIDEDVLPGTPGFSVTRDGRWILWTQVDQLDSDLVLIENLR